MGIRTYDLGESVREVSSPTINLLGNYTILCSETFGVRVADGGSRENLQNPQGSGESFGDREWLDNFSKAAEIIASWPKWKRNWTKAYLNQPLDDGSWMDERGNGAW